MGYVQVIWHPEKSRQVDSSVFPLNGPLRFTAFASSGTTGRRNSNQELEVKGQTALLPATTTHISEEEWELMKTNPHIQRFIDVGAIHAILPRKEEGVEYTGTTLDFDFADARIIVGQNLDLEWLKNCLAVESGSTDKRQPRQREELIKAIKQQIRSIEQSDKKIAAAAALSKTEE